VRTAGSLCTGNSVLATSLPDGSRVRRESHARFCERLEVKSLRPTHPTVPVLAKAKTPTGRLGPMCATTARLPGEIRQRPCSSTRRIVAVSIRSSI
jgi:hypothetical protein